jgi:hypothetical protein
MYNRGLILHNIYALNLPVVSYLNLAVVSYEYTGKHFQGRTVSP